MFVLSLGANVELELERCPPDPPEPAVTENPESGPPASQDIPALEDDEAGQKKTKGKKQRKSKKNPDPEPGPETNANLEGKKGKGKAAVPKPPKEKPKRKPKPTAPPHERLKISMVHGDVLILSGGDYIVRHFLSFLRLNFDTDPSDSAVYANANRDVYLWVFVCFIIPTSADDLQSLVLFALTDAQY